MSNQQYDLGLVGIGVMGSNLLYNMADNGYKMLGYNKSFEKTKKLEAGATEGTTVKGVNSYNDLVNMLAKPRKIMLLVPAGAPVDEVIGELVPLLEKGDIIIDGGNSHYTDTIRRNKQLEELGFNFIGIGVSGGEEGARRGPSMMPGGNKDSFTLLEPILTSIAAKVNGDPCVAYLGKHGAGHYVKMVHNGIEYAIMQMISECYFMLKHIAKLDNKTLHFVFDDWNRGELESFLIEITAAIFTQKDDKTDSDLVDMILDVAGSKGTGKWTSQEAMDRGAAAPSIDVAVFMRNISSFKAEREKAEEIYGTRNFENKEPDSFAKQVHDAMVFGMLLSYAQGMALLHRASQELEMEIPLDKVVQVWKGGCIIRSAMLNQFTEVFKKNITLPNLLLDESIASTIKNKEENTRQVISKAVLYGIPVPALSSALSYFDAYRSSKLSTNLIQAQRDFFGAHTYQRIDEEGKFHTEWTNVK